MSPSKKTDVHFYVLNCISKFTEHAFAYKYFIRGGIKMDLLSYFPRSYNQITITASLIALTKDK